MDLKTTSKKFNEDDSASISEYTDPENNSAPTELLAEFLTSIMRRQWKNALKNCKMILEYEPNNKTANDFYPQLLQRVTEHQSSTSSDENCNFTSSSLDNVDNEILDNDMEDDDSSSSITSSNSTSNGSMDLNSFSEEELGEEMQQEEQDHEDLINASISCDSSDTFPESMSSSESINHRENYSPSLTSLLLDENLADDINNNEPNNAVNSSLSEHNPPNASPFTSKLVNMIRRKLN